MYVLSRKAAGVELRRRVRWGKWLAREFRATRQHSNAGKQDEFSIRVHHLIVKSDALRSCAAVMIWFDVEPGNKWMRL